MSRRDILILERAGDLSAAAPAGVIGVARRDPDWPSWWAVWIVDDQRAARDVPPWLALARRALSHCSPAASVRWEDVPNADPAERHLVLRHGQLLQPVRGLTDQIAAVLRDRCTCTDRDPSLGSILQGHEPDCSLQNTGWLS